MLGLLRLTQTVDDFEIDASTLLLFVGGAVAVQLLLNNSQIEYVNELNDTSEEKLIQLKVTKSKNSLDEDFVLRHDKSKKT